MRPLIYGICIGVIAAAMITLPFLAALAVLLVVSVALGLTTGNRRLLAGRGPR